MEEFEEYCNHKNIDNERLHNHPCKIGFFGPSGTFTEEAASTIGDNLIPFDSILEVLDAVEKGEIDIGVVPIENSIEGPGSSCP